MAIFIPKSYSKQQITVRIEESLLRSADEVATALNLSRSDFFSQCIAYALDNIETGTGTESE